MFKPEDHHREKYFERIRRVKRILRPLPRRATVHKYPVLKWFAESARKRNYLWSFKREDIVLALYVGSILTFLPLYGVQIPLALVLALILRCNLMVVVALQLVSNLLTVPFMWWANYYVGDFFLSVFSIDATALTMEGIRSIDVDEGGKYSEIMRVAFHKYGAISLGGLILGYFLGFILSVIYQSIAKRYAQTHPKRSFAPPIDPVDRGNAGKTVPFPRKDSA